MKVGQTLPVEVLQAEVFDVLGNRTVMRQLMTGPTLVVLLRHFGCIGCQAHMVDLAPRLREFADKGIGVLFVGNGAAHFIEGFVARYSLTDKPVIIATDPSLSVYRILGMNRSIVGAVGLRAWINIFRYVSHGLMQTSVEGDLAQQGGVVLVDHEKKVCFSHHSQRLGDNADTSEIMKAATKIFLQQRLHSYS